MVVKLLRELLDSVPQCSVTGNDLCEVTSIVTDSRKAVDGSLFVCVPGERLDGHDYISDAAARGARCFICGRAVPVPEGVVRVVVPSELKALSRVSAAFFDYPARSLNLIGITGTNGKTTSTYLLESILRTAGVKTALIGTITYRIGETSYPAPFTTPLAHSLHGMLRKMVDSGVETVVLEVSSHALSLSRVDDCRFSVAGFTNLSRDHLDFHTTMDDYFKSKQCLFELLDPSCGRAVINMDDSYGRELAAALGKRFDPITTSAGDGCEPASATLCARGINVGADETSFELTGPFPARPVHLNVRGRFNVANSLIAAGAALAEGIPVDLIIKGLQQLPGIPGRFETFHMDGISVIVDYAHTPAGLENLLVEVRKITGGNIITIFGCGGDRDKTKRPIMGSIAARYSNKVLITNDNPRSEDPASILDEIVQGIEASDENRNRVDIEPDRASAIERAIRSARRGDIVVVAGKGHEDYQIFREKTIHFDDREVVKAVLGLT